jgi:hypothetical protein
VVEPFELICRSPTEESGDPSSATTNTATPGGKTLRRTMPTPKARFRGGSYSPAPIIRMGIVGADEPLSGSTVIAKALASTPLGSGGFITVALP